MSVKHNISWLHGPQTNFVIVSIASVDITSSRGQTVTRVVPNDFPATALKAHKYAGDDTPIEFIQVRQAKWSQYAYYR